LLHISSGKITGSILTLKNNIEIAPISATICN